MPGPFYRRIGREFFIAFLSICIVFFSFSQVQNISLNRLVQILGLSTSRSKVTIIFGGDFMFDRYIRQVAQKHGNDYILEDIRNILVDSDLVVANLEGPITTFSSISIYSQFGSPENYIFTFDPNLVPTLASHNLTLMNIGNNHILNFGVNGLEQTRGYLKQGGINYFGNTGQEADRVFWVSEIKDVEIAFVNHNQFVNKGRETTLATLDLIRDQFNVVVVYAHWGNEYQTCANTTIQDLAHQFIDHGADLIVGSHPHVIQQSEVYQAKTIYYSLGNFVFDQYFSSQTKNGLLLKVNIDSESYDLTYQEIPILLQPNGQTLQGELPI